MQKVIGSLMILSASAAMGFEKSHELKRHLEELEELKRVFVLIRSELQYTKAPFSEVFLKLCSKTKGIFSLWLEELGVELEKREGGTLQEIWMQSIVNQLSNSTLRQEELEELYKVGEGLGYMETLDLYLEQLEITIQKTREEYKIKKKLFQSLGVLGGIFLVIVLV